VDRSKRRDGYVERMRLAVVLPDWTRVELVASSYEVFADGGLTVHFEDGSTQSFPRDGWVDVHKTKSVGL
jgi:hypothetical protein